MPQVYPFYRGNPAFARKKPRYPGRKSGALTRGNRRGQQMRSGPRQIYHKSTSYLPRKIGRYTMRPGRKRGGIVTRTSRARGTGLGLRGRASVLYVTEGLVFSSASFTTPVPNIWPSEAICGHSTFVVKFCVRMQPFVSHEVLDSSCKHSLQGITDGTNFHGLTEFHVNETHPDIVEQMKNYSSFRIKSCRVEITILQTTNSVQNWGNTATNQEAFRVCWSYDKYNVNGLNGGSSTAFISNPAVKVGPSLETMRRMPNFGSKDFIPGDASVGPQIGSYGQDVKHWVIFNKQFPLPPRTSRSIVTGATDAVTPGEWDMRAVHDPRYANAYEVMQDGTLRAGALYVYAWNISTPTKTAASQVLTIAGYPMRIKTWYEIELKDPVETTFINDTPA